MANPKKSRLGATRHFNDWHFVMECTGAVAEDQKELPQSYKRRMTGRATHLQLTTAYPVPVNKPWKCKVMSGRRTAATAAEQIASATVPIPDRKTQTVKAASVDYPQARLSITYQPRAPDSIYAIVTKIRFYPGPSSSELLGKAMQRGLMTQAKREAKQNEEWMLHRELRRTVRAAKRLASALAAAAAKE
jgi:hypothetical protein